MEINLRERIDALRRAADAGQAPAEDVIELALLEMDDLQEDAAGHRLRALIAQQPESGRARVWLAYLYLMCLYESTQAIREILSPLLTEGTANGAAARYLLASSLTLHGGSVAEAHRLLSESTALEPGWVSSWEALSRIEESRGNHATASAQRERAVANVQTEQDSWGTERSAFECLITHRSSGPTRRG